MAEVKNLGPSEVTSFLVILGGFLTALFGDDFGVAERAQEFGVIAAGLASVGTSIARALKHNGAATANATVLAAHAPAALPPATADDLADVEIDGFEDDPDEPGEGVATDTEDLPAHPDDPASVVPVVTRRRPPR